MVENVISPKISNDSFMGKRIETAQMETQIKESHSDNVTNCLKVDVGETLQTTLSLMGKPIVISRNDVTLSNNKCFENFVKSSIFFKCSDTIMTYLFTEHQNKLECKIYLKNKKIFYIDKIVLFHVVYSNKFIFFSNDLLLYYIQK